MAESNSQNVAADAYVVAAGTSKLSAVDRAAYSAAARKYAITGATAQNARFWNDLAALIDASSRPGSAEWAEAEEAIKRSALSVSASTKAALLAWAPGLTSKLDAVKRQLPGWVWFAAAAGVFYVWKGVR